MPFSHRRAQQRTPDQRLAHIIHHPFRTSDDLAARYPSHPHINLLPRLQARGYGRRLIEAFTTALRDRGSRGVHLHVSLGNQRAASFYQHLGFTQLPATGTRLFARDLSKPPEAR